MSTHFEQLPSYEISISQGSKAPDDNTLVGSGDLIVRWPDGRGRRYRDIEHISNCLVLRDQGNIKDAIGMGPTINTYVSYDFGHQPSEVSDPAQPVSASTHTNAPYISNNRKHTTVYVRHAAWTEDLTCIAAFKVPDHPDIAMLPSNAVARIYNCDSRESIKEGAKGYYLDYPGRDRVPVVISRSLEGCRKAYKLGKFPNRETDKEIWVLNGGRGF